MNVGDKQEPQMIVGEALRIGHKGEVLIIGSAITIGTQADAEAFWNERSEKVNSFQKKPTAAVTAADEINELNAIKQTVNYLGKELTKALSDLDEKVDELHHGKDLEPYTGRLASLILKIPFTLEEHHIRKDSSTNE